MLDNGGNARRGTLSKGGHLYFLKRRISGMAMREREKDTALLNEKRY